MFDINASLNEALDTMQERLVFILNDCPSDPEFMEYASHWTNVFETLKNASHFNPLQKMEEISVICNAIVHVLTGCIARRCPHDEQHYFMSRLYVMIQDVGREQKGKVERDLLSIDPSTLTDKDLDELLKSFGA